MNTDKNKPTIEPIIPTDIVDAAEKVRVWMSQNGFTRRWVLGGVCSRDHADAMCAHVVHKDGADYCKLAEDAVAIANRSADDQMRQKREAQARAEAAESKLATANAEVERLGTRNLDIAAEGAEILRRVQANNIAALKGEPHKPSHTASNIATLKAERDALKAEVEKLLGFYGEIVAEIGHDCILKEYRQRGELLRDETRLRKEYQESADYFKASCAEHGKANADLILQNDALRAQVAALVIAGDAVAQGARNNARVFNNTLAANRVAAWDAAKQGVKAPSVSAEPGDDAIATGGGQ